jgi:SAM-dependent methyltransferase
MDEDLVRPTDRWNEGDPYERYVGRWSRLTAREFLSWLAVPPGARWLDVGCGTGALSQAILAQTSPVSVIGLDTSEGYIAHARKQIEDERMTFVVGDARNLPFDERAFDAVVSGLALHFVPEPALAAEEMARVARPGAVVAAYVWDYTGQMQLLRYFWDAATALDPAAHGLDQGRRFPLCHPDALAALFREVSLTQVETRPIDTPTVFRDFDDYWTPFLGGQGPAPSYAISLSEERRATLRERLRATLPTAPDGTITLIARAWAVCGVKI